VGRRSSVTSTAADLEPSRLDTMARRDGLASRDRTPPSFESFIEGKESHGLFGWNSRS
jgi:hypothetical protein